MGAPLVILFGTALGGAAAAWRFVRRRDGGLADRSTTSSAGGGAAAYETTKAVHEYLQFHFARPQDLLPYANGPTDALDFPARCAALCEKFCTTLQDISGEYEEPIALDLGCAVGGATFELARAFPHVLGIDYSHAFVEAAQDMAAKGQRTYEAVIEGDVRGTFVAMVPEDIDRTRARFQQGDACALPANLAQFDAVLAANLLCRLPDPMKFLRRAPSLIKPGGVLVLVSPYSWLAAWTPKDKWLGGKHDQSGKPVRSADAVAAVLSPDFELVHQADMPFLIREHVRKYQWGCSHATVWRRRGADTGAPAAAEST